MLNIQASFKKFGAIEYSGFLSDSGIVFFTELVRTHCRQLKVSHHASNMESTKIETRTNIKFMVKLVDETWLYYCHPEDNIQSKLPRGRSRPVKSKSECSRGKVMVTVFWNAEGILLVDFLENKKTITAAHYEGVLRKLSQKNYRKNALESCINASSSTMTVHSLIVLGKRELCSVSRWEILRHPPYT
nr:uncharacterized protein LOC113811542 [Penaeus vannamei]